MENGLPMTCFLPVLVTAAYVRDAEGHKTTHQETRRWHTYAQYCWLPVVSSRSLLQQMTSGSGGSLTVRGSA